MFPANPGFSGTSRPDVLIFAASILPVDFAPYLRTLLEAAGHPKLLCILPESEAHAIPGLFEAGVTGFILPGADPSDFAAAMRTLRAGGGYFSLALTAALFLPQREPHQRAASFGLTAREREILAYIAMNMSNKDIARRFELSVRTVETHRLNIRKKTNASSWRELSEIANRLDLFGEYRVSTGLPERTAPPGFHED